MNRDVFRWQMTAYQDKPSVDSLRLDIIEAYTKQQAFPVELILALLPLQTAQTADAAARGSFTFSGSKFANVVDDETWIEFEDPVLKTFSATVPAEWTGSVTVTGNDLRVEFDRPIELDIPRLAELGVDRSRFQQYQAAEVSPSLAISYLRESIGEGRETWVEVELEPTALVTRSAALEIQSSSVFRASNNCDTSNPNDPNWYVYQRQGGLCIVHHGTIVVGGQVAYVYKFGPATQAQCSAWADANCI